MSDQFYMFCDTETTGFPSTRIPWDAENQPYMLEFASIITKSCGQVVAKGVQYLNWHLNGFKPIHTEKSDAIHGITEYTIRNYGIAPQEFFSHLALQIETYQPTLVAHNAKFDLKILKIAFARCGIDLTLLDSLPVICTLAGTRERYKTMPAHQRPENAQLGTAFKFFTGHDIGDTYGTVHTSMPDTEACKDLFFALRAKQADV